jgi:hypothetical protein
MISASWSTGMCLVCFDALMFSMKPSSSSWLSPVTSEELGLFTILTMNSMPELWREAIAQERMLMLETPLVPSLYACFIFFHIKTSPHDVRQNTNMQCSGLILALLSVTLPSWSRATQTCASLGALYQCNLVPNSTHASTQPTISVTPVQQNLTGVAGVESSYDYGQVLGLSYLFYEAQVSGVKPAWNRVAWRGDSHVDDPVPGGLHDAGDMIKATYPLSTAAALMAWVSKVYSLRQIASSMASIQYAHPAEHPTVCQKNVCRV